MSQTPASSQNTLPPSPYAVLLRAVDLAQSRGAYKVNEMSLIGQAYQYIANVLRRHTDAVNAAKQTREMQDTMDTLDTLVETTEEPEEETTETTTETEVNETETTEADTVTDEIIEDI